MKTLFLCICLEMIGLSALAQIFIPVSADYKEEARVMLTYYANPGGNRPSASLQFSDGTEFFLTCVCEGDYDWCIRNAANEDIGYLSIRFYWQYGIFKGDGEYASLDLKMNSLSSQYGKYLNLLPGEYWKAEEIDSGTGDTEGSGLSEGFADAMSQYSEWSEERSRNDNTLKWYECERCGKVVLSTGKLPDEKCPKEDNSVLGMVFVIDFHVWGPLGEAGNTKYYCRKCKIRVQTKYTPNEGKCAIPDGTEPHDWILE